MKLDLLACHGSGNAFILIDEVSGQNPLIPERKRAKLSRVLCDREHGIGADGILYYRPSDTADRMMRMYNPDGSEAEMCGNGLRCAGRYAIEALQQNSVLIETPQANLKVSQADPLMPGIPAYAAEIGPVSMSTKTLSMRTMNSLWKNRSVPGLPEELLFTALSIPNPHIVTFVEQIDESLVHSIGQRANKLALFAQGVNLSFVKVIDQNTLFVITYERGVGITQACGTAMSASSYVSVQQGHAQATQPIKVYNKGGMVLCGVNMLEQRVMLQGNATYTARYQVTLDKNSLIKRQITDTYTTEQQAYVALQAQAQKMMNTCKA